MTGSEDTILALASGPLPSALAVIRVSGPHVEELIASHLVPASLKPRHATLVHVQDGSGNILDQSIAIHYPGTASFTGEPALELMVHGGRAVVDGIRMSFLDVPGLRLAEPGEFTRRAVLAGKLDLMEAEGIADLVDAETAAQRAQALAHMKGDAAGQFQDWYTELLSTLSLLEAMVDFPDEDDAPEDTLMPVTTRIHALSEALESALSDEHVGERIRDGFSVVILGAPNAGKSSLLNALAGRDAAIVTDIPGTTRDIVEVRLDLGGYLVRVSDTAGLRVTDDPVEREGIRRAKASAETADLVIGLVDLSAVSDEDVFAGLKIDLMVANKADLLDEPDESVSRETFLVSALTGEGVGELVRGMTEYIADKVRVKPDPLIARARHRSSLEQALAALSSAKMALDAKLGAEFVAEDVRAAARALEVLLGKIGVEDILGAVFSEFCIGK
ncbi:MAG: tRNA uridine-5-carboxymethylaminomethyl(34) synthesis GTPase MnmE [Hyphomonadaceae bacterium]|nr:tRNA uridine-5-carboxymethylaminomethyl(34) synthesis GTPase MnmE [Hyphomonadaceae bacterium]